MSGRFFCDGWGSAFPSAGMGRALLGWGVFAAAGSGALADPAVVPIKPGVKFVLAVDNSEANSTLTGLLQGDYEMMVALESVSDEGVTQRAYVDGVDERGIQQRGTIPRLVPTADIEGAREQVLGFYSDDPQVLAGTTSLGPSLPSSASFASKARRSTHGLGEVRGAGTLFFHDALRAARVIHEKVD